jgi:hypothetical protein
MSQNGAMALRLSIVDETTAGERHASGALELDVAGVTVREILRLRVQQEVNRFNQSQSEVFRGLVQPEETERILNGIRERRPIQWERQLEKAVAAFESNSLLVLVDDRHITQLDEQVRLTERSNVTFLRLVPLVGG